MSDQDVQELEDIFPALSGEAFAAARERVIASGLSVLQSEGDVIVEVSPDGQKKFVKKIEPPMYLEIGSTFTIR
jgi:hypothetical protein